MSPPAPLPSSEPPLGKAHARRLRQIYGSAGWPCHDAIEIDLLAAGMLQRVLAASGHESLRVTDDGMRLVAAMLQGNRASRSQHEALVEEVALEMQRCGRIAWRGLGLRAQVPAEGGTRWCMARPDVFSIRNTSVAEYVEPVVHEIKVRRSDLLADLGRIDKRRAYLDLGQCWYVLGHDARGRPIGDAGEVPPECGVMLWEQGRLRVVRLAPRRERAALPFGVWMALAKATPVAGLDEETQPLLAITQECQGGH
ncbi:hypothetical protein [Ramlibacter tataouinensis]|uniref:Uncharacterized protein n=1 Tax=Ramlibacter tataouinensis (strain ATCC BAA-407 / DSM 14655 / LMG 21543 / TTB310) TaxID=365046 RepID=F5Y0D7_RAMTT|nr:hypothetical protein [Ramlibacter tataouinensis]AEG92159.1 conserved hypothetical protein [Ramlibacter tataouinensis TTB310]